MYPELGLYIDGEWLRTTRATMPVVNPATGQPIGALPTATTDDLDAAIEAAERGFAVWRNKSAYDRGRILKGTADLLRERAGSIARILTLEQGKTVTEALGEVQASADIIEWYGEEGRRVYGRIVPSRAAGLRQMVVHEPVGVAAAFTPWNFPALTPARKIGGALGAGCALILKPSEETPGTAIEVARAFADAGLPAGVLNLVFGSPDHISRHLIAAAAVRKISFTGSTNVGKQLMGLAAQHVKRTTMELGGHAPVIVCADADVQRTATLVAQYKYRNAGQVCISPTRFYVHESILSPFVDAFVSYAKQLKLGNGLDDGVTMGPLANGRRVEAMERLVSDAKSHGASVRTGGNRHGRQGYFFEPTVLTEVTDSALIMREEPFGPVAPVVPFHSLEEAIERANSLPVGLAAFAFTRSNSEAALLGNALKSGMVGLNTFAISQAETPFGGIAESGHGHEGGTEGLHAYLDVKLIAHGS
jgi:succinate-semialdehyde dehydrogenase/glutarate-semialdehyde dehydrogenase